MKSLKTIGIIFCVLLSINSYAWDGSESGVIRRVEVADGENYGFRVRLEGDPAMCGNSHQWAFINKSYSNYEVYVSALMAAHMAKRSVTIYTNREQSSGNEYCQIGYLVVN